MKQFHTITIIFLLFIVTGKAQEITWTTLHAGGNPADISCVNENVTYVCGLWGHIGKTIDGGKTWTVLKSNAGVLFQTIKFMDEQLGFVGGGAVTGGASTPVEKGGIVLKTTDGGLSWLDITPTSSINIVDKIFPIDEDTIYILQSGILLKTTNAGISWDTAFPMILKESITNFYMIDSVGYAIIDSEYNGGAKIYRTLDYAQTWQEVYRNSSLNLLSCDLVFLHPDTVYVYLPDSLLYTTDGFATYERHSHFLGYHSLVKIKYFSNGNYCVIAGIWDEYYFYGNINGEHFCENVPFVYAVDGCNDSIFYINGTEGTIYTNRYFEPVNAGIDINDESLSVFPNPTTGQLTIENEGLTIKNIEIIDIMGKKHPFSKAPSPLERAGGEAEIDISHLPAGMYFLRIETEKGSITKKIIKQYN